MLGLLRYKILVIAAAAALGAVTAFGAPAKSNGPSQLEADSVTYDVKKDLVIAKGHVVMTTTDGKAAGDYAEYYSKTQSGVLRGNVVADKGDMHMVCDEFIVESPDHVIAIGNVHATQLDRKYDGPKAEYFKADDFVRMDQGGTVSSKDGTFTADYMEGWPGRSHFRGTGNAHLVSPPKNFEGGGDDCEYFGPESNGRAVLRGNAWAIQNDNYLKSKEIVVYLDDQGNTKAKAEADGDQPAKE